MLRIDPNTFRQEEIKSENPVENKNPVAQAHKKALQIYQETKQYKKSIEILQKAKVDEIAAKSLNQVSLTKGQYTTILNDYAYFLYLDGQHDKALAIFNKVIQLAPERTVAYLNRGNIYRGKFNQTRDNKFKKLFSDDYQTYNEMMIKNKQSCLIPDRVEKELYTLSIKKPFRAEDKKEPGERLIKAAERNNKEEVIKLLKEGADPNYGAYDEIKDGGHAVGEEHKVALHYAAENNNIEMVKYLLNNGAKIVETRQGLTPLFFAAESANLEMVRYLIKKGERFDRISRPYRGFSSPLHYAARGERSGYDVFEYLFNLYGGDYRRFTGDQAELTLELSVMDASKLKNYEKGYRVVKTMWEVVEKIKEFVKTGKDRVIDNYRIRNYEEAFKQAYINAVSVNNEKLITFLSSKNIEIDKNKYIVALLNAKRFEEAKKEIENSKEISGEVLSPGISLIPLYKTDWKCEEGVVRYEGNELEELLLAVMKKYDVNWVDPPRFPDIFPNELRRDYNSYVDRFIHQIIKYSKEKPSCLSKDRVVKIMKLMADNASNLYFLNRYFIFIISLNEIEFAGELLRKGVKVSSEKYVYLFANAKTMEMVRFLESEGFSLSRDGYKEVFEKYKTYPGLLQETDKQVIEYYQFKIK